MLIRNFGITLVQLAGDDIELVRHWRNSPGIVRFMDYRFHISGKQQQQWFRSLDPLRDFYFIVQYKNQKIGLIHTSATDWKTKTAHTGLFIWDKNYFGTHIPVLASLAMLECFFGKFNLLRVFAKVCNENSVARKYNASLGFKLLKASGKTGFDIYVLEKEDYIKSSEKIKSIAEKISDGKEEIIMDGKLASEIEKLMILFLMQFFIN